MIVVRMHELKRSGPKTDVMYRDMTVPQADHFHLINLDKKITLFPKFFQSEKLGGDKTFTVRLYLDVGIPPFSLIFQ